MGGIQRNAKTTVGGRKRLEHEETFLPFWGITVPWGRRLLLPATMRGIADDDARYARRHLAKETYASCCRIIIIIIINDVIVMNRTV